MRPAWDTKSKKNKYDADDRESFSEKYAHSVASRPYHHAKQRGFFSGKNILESLEAETQPEVNLIARQQTHQYHGDVN